MMRTMSGAPQTSIQPPDEAGLWMHRGLDLLEAGTPDGLAEAVRCFDRAITLRRVSHFPGDPSAAYGLAAGWLNRGDALARIEYPGQVAEAIRSYDEALALLLTLPLEHDPLYPRRLAIAWINRGLARQKEGTPLAVADAGRCFRAAIGVLESAPAAAITGLPLLRAGTLINLAGVLLDLAEPSLPEARTAALRALPFVRDTERTDRAAAEIGLKARHLLCRALAAESSDGRSIPPERMAEAMAAVEDGLALGRLWRASGEEGFLALEEDLFRFGCRIHPANEPNFLATFLLENLDPEKANGVPPLNGHLHEAAVAALRQGLREIQRRGFPSPSTPPFERLLEDLRGLRVAEERLARLHLKATA
jgi:hypothetical protein